VFQKKVLRKTLGLQGDEVKEEWRGLHNEELTALHSSPNIILVIKSRRMRWAWQVARMTDWRRALSVLVARPDGKRPFGSLRRRWEENIRMVLQ
jgi:hypothetical protein